MERILWSAETCIVFCTTRYLISYNKKASIVTLLPIREWWIRRENIKCQLNYKMLGAVHTYTLYWIHIWREYVCCFIPVSMNYIEVWFDASGTNRKLNNFNQIIWWNRIPCEGNKIMEFPWYHSRENSADRFFLENIFELQEITMYHQYRIVFSFSLKYMFMF